MRLHFALYWASRFWHFTVTFKSRYLGSAIAALVPARAFILRFTGRVASGILQSHSNADIPELSNCGACASARLHLHFTVRVASGILRSLGPALCIQPCTREVLSSLDSVQHIEPEAPATQFRELSAPGGKGFISDILQRAPLFWGQGGASSCKVCYKLDGLSRTFSACAIVLRAAGVSAPYVTPAISGPCAWGNGLGHTLCS